MNGAIDLILDVTLYISIYRRIAVVRACISISTNCILFIAQSSRHSLLSGLDICNKNTNSIELYPCVTHTQTRHFKRLKNQNIVPKPSLAQNVRADNNDKRAIE